MTQSSSSGFIAVALAFAILALPIALQAQSFSEFHSLSPDEKHAYWDSMSEQERQAKRQQWRAERDAMSDAERAAMHAVGLDVRNGARRFSRRTAGTPPRAACCMGRAIGRGKAGKT